MVTTRLISFLLMFTLLHLRDCCAAHSHQDTKKNVAADAMIELEEVVFDGVPTGAEVKETYYKPGGRKMKEEVLNEKESTISGAAHSIGNCKRKTKASVLKAVECKLMKIRRHRRTDRSQKVKMAGFTAFSADYHVPKSHPPRNN